MMCIMKKNISYDHLIVKCVNTYEIEQYFKINEQYNCIFIEDEFRVNGTEFILHCNLDFFSRRFKILKRNKVMKYDE